MAGSSFLDMAKEIGLKARDAVAKNSDKIDDAVDRAADFVDTKTKGKYSDKIVKAKSAAHDALGKLEETPDGGKGRPAAADRSPADEPPAPPKPPAAAEPEPPSAPEPPASPEPPVATPDPGLGDQPVAGPSDVAGEPPVAKPDPEAPQPG